MTALRIGILADQAIKQAYLGDLVTKAGHKVATTWVLGEVPLPDLPDLAQSLDAWIVDIHEADEAAHESDALTHLMDELFEQDKLVILSESNTHDPHQAIDGERRLLQRLERLSGDLNLRTEICAKEVWILAASTGGPVAVKDFIAALPADLGVAFVYVQHIDKGQADTLVKMLNNAGHYAASVGIQGTVLKQNSITLVTSAKSIEILANGTVQINTQNWKGIYSPSIDQVAANIARVYRSACGMIVFSGLGDDGAASCKLIKQQGGKIWVQTPSQCTSASMPEAALATQTVSQQGTPEELASAFAKMKIEIKNSSIHVRKN